MIEGDSSGPHPLPPDADQSLMAAVLQKVLSCRANLSDALNEELVRVRQDWFDKWTIEHDGTALLKAGAPSNVDADDLGPYEYYHINTGRGGTFYQVLAPKHNRCRDLSASTLVTDHACKYRFDVP